MSENVIPKTNACCSELLFLILPATDWGHLYMTYYIWPMSDNLATTPLSCSKHQSPDLINDYPSMKKPYSVPCSSQGMECYTVPTRKGLFKVRQTQWSDDIILHHNKPCAVLTCSVNNIHNISKCISSTLESSSH